MTPRAAPTKPRRLVPVVRGRRPRCPPRRGRRLGRRRGATARQRAGPAARARRRRPPSRRAPARPRARRPWAGWGGRPGEPGQQHDEADAEGEPAAGEQSGQGGQREGHDEHGPLQDELVVGAEVRDRPLLDRCRGEVDDRRPDGEHRRGGGVEEAGGQVAGGDAGHGGEDPAEGVSEADHAVWFVAGPRSGCVRDVCGRIGKAGHAPCHRGWRPRQWCCVAEPLPLAPPVGGMTSDVSTRPTGRHSPALADAPPPGADDPRGLTRTLADTDALLGEVCDRLVEDWRGR